MASKIPTVHVRHVDDIEYTLSLKAVKRFNLRVRTDGSIAVSVPRGTGVLAADRFVLSHTQWIRQARERCIDCVPEEDCYSNESCMKIFMPVFDRMYPLVSHVATQKPLLKVRFMKSRWGVCHIARNYITLNKQLMDKPIEALEYVVLHELVHLLHPNHQAGFHQEMQRLMPDYLKRRALLR